MIINCLIGEVNFQFIVHSLKMISQLQKYQSEAEGDVVIKVVFTSTLPSLPNEKIISSTFYEIYQGECLYQKQMTADKQTLGIIVYHENNATIYIDKKFKTFASEYLMCEYAFLYFVFKRKKGILIHSSSFAYQGNGYLLVASSGTGKSTHADLWRKYCNVTTINDDKNLILLKDNQLLIYPNPFSGKSLIDNNLIVPLKGIVLLSRGKNAASKVKPKDGFIKLLPHILNTSFMLAKEIWDEVTDKILSSVNFYALSCDISQEAVLTLKKVMEDDYEI